jgi:23S rRNA (cytidine1920-2'-O)/16S rRNA (cytidine1409-2'-O)-methyltransferase
MVRSRLDQTLVSKGLTSTRSQAESYIKLGFVNVGGKKITKPGFLVNDDDNIKLTVDEQYVSRAALKLASVAKKLSLDFRNKVVLDVGSSTGGFTQYALKNGAKKVIAIEVGTNQLHPDLQGEPKIELHEKTDIRNFNTDEIYRYSTCRCVFHKFARGFAGNCKFK